MNAQKYLVIGRGGLDLAPEPPGTAIEDALTYSTSLGGSAANICAGLCRLGGTATLFTALSEDAVGDYVMNQLRHYGIGTEASFRVGQESRNSLALTEARLVNHRTIIYRNNASDLLLSTDHVEQIDFSTYTCLIITGTALAIEPTRSATFAAIDKAVARGMSIGFDIDYRPYSWVSAEDAHHTLLRVAEASDLIMGNDEEFDVLAGPGGNGKATAESLTASRDDRVVVYKQGKEGGIVMRGADRETYTPFLVQALKPTGAGDSFMAGFLHTLHDGGGLMDAARFGAASAAIVVSKPGCAPAMPTPDQVNAFLSKVSSGE